MGRESERGRGREGKKEGSEREKGWERFQLSADKKKDGQCIRYEREGNMSHWSIVSIHQYA